MELLKPTSTKIKLTFIVAGLIWVVYAISTLFFGFFGLYSMNLFSLCMPSNAPVANPSSFLQAWEIAQSPCTSPQYFSPEVQFIENAKIIAFFLVIIFISYIIACSIIYFRRGKNEKRKKGEAK